MTLDHFRPKEFYGYLTNDPTNLVYSCRKCNELKANHWPAIGTDGAVVNGEGFIDPFVEDRNDYFGVRSDGLLMTLKPPAQYMVKILLLNRSWLCKLREKRERACENWSLLVPLLDKAIEDVNAALQNDSLAAELREALKQDRERLKKLRSEELRALGLDFTLY